MLKIVNYYRLEVGSLQLGLKFRRVWPVDIGPTPNYQSRVCVCVQGETALQTLKYSLTRPVGLVHIAAARALSAGVARVHVDYRDTRKSSLVADKLTQLCERPPMQLASPCRAVTLGPLPNAFQVLKDQGGAGALRGLHKLLSYAVVFVRHKAPFALGASFQFPLGRLRTLALQLGPKFAVAVPNVVDVLSGVAVARRVHRHVRYAKVYAEVALNVFGRRFRHFARRQKVEFAPGVNEVAFTLLKLEPLKLTLTRREQHFLTALKRPDRHAELVQLPRQDTSVIGNRAVWPEGALDLAVQLVSVGYLPLYTDSNLSRKSEPVSDLPVNELMERELPPRLRIPSHTRDVVARLISPLKSGKQSGVLFGSGQELNLGGELHPSILPYFQGVERALKGLPFEDGGIRPFGEP